MLYTLADMASVRTQIYLTVEQRARLEKIRRLQGTTLADLIRQAVDQFLTEKEPDPAAALDSTFATMPELAVVDREEWDRG